jgi:ribosomal protein L7Ae-like RNA K-turn-binding protein
MNLEHNILDMVGKANKNSSIIVGEKLQLQTINHKSKITM